MTGTWSFSINEDKKLDWQRLVADALAEGLDAFTVKLNSSDFTLLFVRNTLLEKVTAYDRISLCNYSVGGSWGKETDPELIESRGGFEVKYDYYSTARIYHYRYMIVQNNVFNSEEVKEQLDTLRNFKRKAVVKVESI